eukprot:310425-Prymnesium_polylepis.1
MHRRFREPGEPARTRTANCKGQQHTARRERERPLGSSSPGPASHTGMALSCRGSRSTLGSEA